MKLTHGVLAFLFPATFLAASIHAAVWEDAMGNAEREIKNFHIVDKGELYRGARVNASQMKILNDLGVKTIVNLQGGDLNRDDAWKRAVMARWEPGERPEMIEAERNEALKYKIEYINEPIDSLEPINDKEADAIRKLLPVMHDPSRQPVYVHCEHGADRTGMLIALYRVQYDGMSIEDAHREMEANGHAGVLHHAFTGSMDDFFYREAAAIKARRQ